MKCSPWSLLNSKHLCSDYNPLSSLLSWENYLLLILNSLTWMKNSPLKSKFFKLRNYSHSSFRVRLAQVTNKCNTAEELDFFVRECGDILGVSDKVKNKNDPKAIISYILEQLVYFFKASNFWSNYLGLFQKA